MGVLQVFNIFWQWLKAGYQCSHSRVNLACASGFCPDCGYAVKIEWALTQCRGCNAKRIPQQNFWGDIAPLETYCRHCGHDKYRIVKKAHIEAHELVYALSVKTTDYSEPSEWKAPNVASAFKTSMKSSFKTWASMADSDFIDAEVVSRTEFTQSRQAGQNFNQDLFNWQTRQNPGRYGGGYPKHPPGTLVPILN